MLAGRVRAIALLLLGAAACASTTPSGSSGSAVTPASSVATGSDASPAALSAPAATAHPSTASATRASEAPAVQPRIADVSPTGPRGECGQPIPPSTMQLSVSGVLRTALTAVPPDYDRGLVPVVIALHGYDQEASDFASYAGLFSAGSAAGVMVVVPQGIGDPPGWNVPDSTEVGPSDVRFLRALIDRLLRTTCADPDRLVLAGLSDGSDMAVTAACALHGRVAGLLLVAASTGPSPSCRPEDVVQVHGTADPIDAYKGRTADTRRGFGSVKAAGAERAFALWSALDGCRSHVVRRRADLRTFVAQRCDHGAVELIAVQHGGHTWPGAAPRPALGRTTRSLNTRSLLTLILGAIAATSGRGA